MEENTRVSGELGGVLQQVVEYLGDEIVVPQYQDGPLRDICVHIQGAIGDFLLIPAEELPLLFERFHKSDKSRSRDKDGVGLGLYIVKTILEQHREKINVTSENGCLPRSAPLPGLSRPAGPRRNRGWIRGLQTWRRSPAGCRVPG